MCSWTGEKKRKEEEEGLFWSYLRACGAFPVHNVVVELGPDFPHGAVGAGQGVRDVDVQDAPSRVENHSARGAQGSWQEEETDMRSRAERLV